MPYIPVDRRYDLIERGVRPTTAGDLNYLFTANIKAFLNQNGLSYTSLNAAIGALECCKLELYRRLATIYEDQKIIENGDVY